jgi:hypothetical protein
MPNHSIERFITSDELAHWWGARRGLLSGDPGAVAGAHRALEVRLLQAPQWRPARADWRKVVRDWEVRTGRREVLAGLVRRPNFFVDWLAARDCHVGDAVDRSLVEGWRADLEGVAYAFVSPHVAPGQQIWRRHGQAGWTHRPALVLTRIGKRVLLDVVVLTKLVGQRLDKGRAKARKNAARRSPAKRRDDIRAQDLRKQAARAALPVRNLDGALRQRRKTR